MAEESKEQPKQDVQRTLMDMWTYRSAVLFLAIFIVTAPLLLLLVGLPELLRRHHVIWRC
jgi:hypothetical protein